jgi:hypothetical protein
MIATPVALGLLIGWLVGLQAVWVGRDLSLRAPQAVRITTAVLSGGAALLVVPRLHARGLLVGPDVTAAVILAAAGWFAGLQAVQAGRDSPRSPLRSSRAARMTTVVLSAGVLLLAVPDLYHLLAAP